MDQVYPDMGGAWEPDEYRALVSQFPEGQICIEDKGQVVAASHAILVNGEDFESRHSYEDVIDGGKMTAHDPEGNSLYGIDVFVDPDYRGLRLGRRLYDARKELCEKLNLKGIIFGGRIPGYGEHAADMTPSEYIRKVKAKEIYDPVLSFQLSNDFHIKKILKNYIAEDTESASYGVLMEWNNIFYQKRQRLFGGRKSYPRIGVVQWQMRPFAALDEFLHQVEFFVDAMAGYNTDLILFPELLNAPLLQNFNQENPTEAMRSLAEYTEEIRASFVNLAISYNTNIVAGSVPLIKDDTIYNVSFLCRRDGTWDEQYKLHITPDEAQYWGFKGGRTSRSSTPTSVKSASSSATMWSSRNWPGIWWTKGWCCCSFPSGPIRRTPTCGFGAAPRPGPSKMSATSPSREASAICRKWKTWTSNIPSRPSSPLRISPFPTTPSLPRRHPTRR